MRFGKVITQSGEIKGWKEMSPDERAVDQLRHFVKPLARWVGSRAKLWRYHATHNSLVIRLERDGERAGLHIGISADFINGPVMWEDSQIEIRYEPQSGYIIEDTRAGFRVVGGCPCIRENVDFNEDAEPQYRSINHNKSL